MPKEFSLFEECKANAKAFDALPDIVKALQLAIYEMECCNLAEKDKPFMAAISQARAALKKGGF